MSHPSGEDDPYLEDHLARVAERAKNIVSGTRFEGQDIAYYSGLLHDIGKLNPLYQKLFSGTPTKQAERELEKIYVRAHAPYSAHMALSLLSTKNGFSCDDINKAVLLIYGHHTALHHELGGYSPKASPARVERTLDGLRANAEKFAGGCDRDLFGSLDWDTCVATCNEPPQYQLCLKPSQGTAEFLRLGFLYSALLQADCGSFTQEASPPFDLQYDTSILARPHGQPADPRHALARHRSEFQRLATETFDPDEPVTVIHAPTGIGKTKTFLDIVQKHSARYERVFYFSPLLALTEDFESKMKEITSDDDYHKILKYNHLFSGTLDEAPETETIRRPWSYLNESFNRPFVITTMQRLLITLYSNKAGDKMKLASFRNALLIVDEVQTIPKRILNNVVCLLRNMSEYMGTKTLLVSATIPHEISDVRTIDLPASLTESYMRATTKPIRCVQKLDYGDMSGKFLIMANTRRKALAHWNSFPGDKTNLRYLSSGIKKKAREGVLGDLRNPRIGLISTQVVEAGVDISFSRIYREMAPLDNLVQILGRLNREMTFSDPELVVFEDDSKHQPYSELEYERSRAYLSGVEDSLQLYGKLPRYYEEVSARNAAGKSEEARLDKRVSDLNFDLVWKTINPLFHDHNATAFIPEAENWREARDTLMRYGPQAKTLAPISASLPVSPYNAEVRGLLDEDLFEKGRFFPKQDRIDELYSGEVGLDVCLQTK